MKVQFALRRWDYGDCGLFEGELFASNGSISVRADLYLSDDELIGLGAAFMKFPTQVPDRYEFTTGAENPRSAMFLLFGAYTVGRLGQCALKVRVNNNRSEPIEQVAELSIATEPAGVNRLGSLLVSFAKERRMTVLHWTPQDGELFEEDQPSLWAI